MKDTKKTYTLNEIESARKLLHDNGFLTDYQNKMVVRKAGTMKEFLRIIFNKKQEDSTP